MDIAHADYEGTAISWISKTGITAPEYYEKEGKNWLRSFYGGFRTTCGLSHIGNPMGEHITYQRETLPDFLIWKMLGESEYVVGLEPRTTSYGGPEIKENNKYVALKSFEEYRTKLKFEVRKK